MAVLTNSLGAELAIRADSSSVGTLGALNAEVVLATGGCAGVLVDLRTAAGNLTLAFEASVDGVNFYPVPARRLDTMAIVTTIAITTTLGVAFELACTGYRLVRVRCSAYVSGNAAAVLLASLGALLPSGIAQLPAPSTLHVTAVGAVNAAVTCTLPAGGPGLRHYVTSVRIDRLYSVVGVPAAAGTGITSTNLPGSPVWSSSQRAAEQGTLEVQSYDYPSPLAATALNTTTTLAVVAQLQTIWRLSAWYYLAP